MSDAEASDTELDDTDKYPAVRLSAEHRIKVTDSRPLDTEQLSLKQPSPHVYNPSLVQQGSPQINTPLDHDGLLAKDIDLEETWHLSVVPQVRASRWARLKTIWKWFRKKREMPNNPSG